MLELGLAGLPVVVAAIATGLVFVTWFNRKLGLPPRLGTLVAAGTSICGVTAIVSTAPAIEADEREVAYAVANVVAFGLFGMLVYPYLAHALLARSETIGLFLGTAVHDTSQVVGAALTYKQLYGDDVVLRTAMVTKLTRNIFLAVVIPLLTWMHVRGGGGGSGTRTSSASTSSSWARYVPGFVLGFLGMALVRSVGDAMVGRWGAAYGVFDAPGWAAFTAFVGDTLASRCPAGDGDGRGRAQHQRGRVQGDRAEAFCGRVCRRARRRRGRHADGGPLRRLRHAVTPCHGDWPRDTRFRVNFCDLY